MTTEQIITTARQQRTARINRWAQRKNDEATAHMIQRGGAPQTTNWDAVVEQLRAEGKLR